MNTESFLSLRKNQDNFLKVPLTVFSLQTGFCIFIFISLYLVRNCELNVYLHVCRESIHNRDEPWWDSVPLQFKRWRTKNGDPIWGR